MSERVAANTALDDSFASPSSAKLHCSRGEVIAHVGDTFEWFGVDSGGRWRIEAFTNEHIYSPSGLGGTPIVRCRNITPVPDYWENQRNPDGSIDWCGDSVGAALLSVGDAKLSSTRGTTD